MKKLLQITLFFNPLIAFASGPGAPTWYSVGFFIAPTLIFTAYEVRRTKQKKAYLLFPMICISAVVAQCLVLFLAMKLINGDPGSVLGAILFLGVPVVASYLSYLLGKKILKLNSAESRSNA